MTLDEARQILGIAEDADPPALRRAYLRRVKQHSPERDPEGFMRVRQAFELAGAWATYPEAESQPELEDIPLPRAVTVLPDVARDVARPESQARNEQASASALDHVTDERVRAGQVFRERLAEANSVDDERAILREALARGHAEFVLDARHMSPDLLSDTQLSDWLDEQLDRPDWSWAILAGALLVRGRAQDALRTGLARLAAQHRGPDGDLVLGEQLDLQGTTFTLDLLAHGLDVEAARFGDQYLAVRDPLSRADPLRFEALRQLLSVHTRLPRDVVLAIAAALRDHQPHQADDALSDICASDKSLAAAARKTLKRDAPMLSNLFAAALSGSAGVPWYRDRLRPPPWVYTAVLVGLVNVLRITCQDRSPPEPPPPVVRQSELVRASYSAAADTCATMPAPICEVVVRFAQARNCDALRRCAGEADAEVTRTKGAVPPDTRVQVLAQYIVNETRALCGKSVDGQR